MKQIKWFTKTFFLIAIFVLSFQFNVSLLSAQEHGFVRKDRRGGFPIKQNAPVEHKPIPRYLLYSPELSIEKEITDLQFTPDSGIRVEFANLPNAGIDPDTGEVHLYYQTTREHPSIPGKPMHSISNDGLSFIQGESLLGPERETRYPYDSRNTLLPDGSWRRYGIRPGLKYVSSYFSSDGINFRPEEGARYELQPDDFGWMGVHTAFKNSLGGIVYIYLGDKRGLNNARLAYSEDGGETFEFKKSNVFGDADLGGGGQSFVDPASLVLTEGRVRIITMRMCHIYTFISIDERCTNFAYEGMQLEPSDFKEFKVKGLFDPKLVLLPDGRMRVYVAASVEQEDGSVIDSIVSATSKPIK